MRILLMGYDVVTRMRSVYLRLVVLYFDKIIQICHDNLYTTVSNLHNHLNVVFFSYTISAYISTRKVSE